jgi:ATP-dependent DNA helicase RecG
LTGLTGIGPEMARKLGALGVATPGDLLAYLPRDYKDWRNPAPIASLPADGSEVIALGEIVNVTERRARLPLVSAEIADESGTLLARWFGRRHLFGALHRGQRIFVSGRLNRGKLFPELNVTAHRLLGTDGYRGEIVPVYPASADLPSRTIRSLVAKNLAALIAQRPDVLPRSIVERFGFLALSQAWQEIHRPSDLERLVEARRRLVFEEFFAIALAAAQKRAEREARGGAPPLANDPAVTAEFEAGLPFRLTAAQRRVIEEIRRDMTRASPMNRLLQGDVGCGKTLVAAAAVVLASRAGMQSALMAPTEILATQHAKKLAPLLLPHGIAIEVLLGSQSDGRRRHATDRLRSGEAALAVGTHALLTESIEFARLGLVVIDEQHRFGVEQRAALRSKSREPHTLYMTATPIPRTLAQTKYADLDLSIIDELPPGRTPIETYVVRESRKEQVYEFVRLSVERGGQAYVVAPAIDESQDGALTSAIAEAERLQSEAFAGLRVDVLHGRLPAREKDRVMGDFAAGRTQVLIATTVVEVGVDVPNASVMVILDAHRYGLAQLHQLRGRVGRGVARSFCVLVAPDDAADVERLAILAETDDGFKVAEEDLRLRREGEFAGTAQAGIASSTIGNIVQDFELYMKAKAQADAIVASDPQFVEEAHRGLRTLVDSVATARAMLVSS